VAAGGVATVGRGRGAMVVVGGARVGRARGRWGQQVTQRGPDDGLSDPDGGGLGSC